MIKNKPGSVLFLTFLIITVFGKPAFSQMLLGQYEDEAPLRTWNILGVTTASSLGLGGVQLASPGDTSAALVNPSLLFKHPKLAFTLSASSSKVSLMKYGIVNTGPITLDETPYYNHYAFDFIGLAVNLSGWVLSLSSSVMESYARPVALSEVRSDSHVYYHLSFNQKGLLRNINLALSRKVNKKLSLGLAVNYVFGNNEKSIEEKWFSSNITITDEKKHDFKGFFINGGFNLEMTEKFSLAGIFRTPYIKKSDSQSLLRYFSPGGDTDIRIDAVGNNSYNQPFVVGLGLQYVFSKNFRAAADFNFFDWSSYKIDYFNEELDRNFKNVLKIGTGVEYSMPAKFIRQDIRVFYRLGASYDPQPMKIADSYYLGLTLGTGIQWRRYFLDLGILLAQEFGSGDDLNSRVFVITLGHK
jgi:hypothetical protein